MAEKVNINEYGFAYRVKAKKYKMFKIGKSLKILEDLIPEPPKEESFRAISYQGGFSSISFITYIALKEPIEELSISTLRVGEKQFLILKQLKEMGKLNKVNFITGGVLKADKNKGYSYYDRFIKGCKDNNWNYAVVHNHSKIILMKTRDNYYVIETSSNLNENPQVEQFTFENDKALYTFYYEILHSLI